MLQSETVKKYDKYKDSGIEWIGEIPQNWDVKRLKVLAKLQTGNTPPKENDVSAYYTDEGFLWVKPDNLSGFSPIKNTNEYLNEEGYKIARVVPKGTPLVCCIGSIGKYGVAEQDVAFNQQINAVIFNKMMDNKFGLYHISCQEEQHWYYANGNVVQILNTQNQGKLLFACPPINEQKQIAEYLDKKCGEIDRVVETEKAVIEKLKEYKQSIITEAVTKGLDKSVPMKNSGIEWIGQIPEHWDATKLKRLTQILTCGYASTPQYYDEGIPFLSAQNVKNGKLCLDKFNRISEELHQELTKYKKPQIGDILQVRVGATIGQTCIVDCNLDFSIYVSLTHIRTNERMNNRYLSIILGSKSFINEAVNKTFQGGGVGNLNVQDLRNIYCPIPSKEEQQAIADYLDKKCSEIDKAIADKERVIEKFIEYKKSLIYECVTGKRKVVA